MGLDFFYLLVSLEKMVYVCVCVCVCVCTTCFMELNHIRYINVH